MSTGIRLVFEKVSFGVVREYFRIVRSEQPTIGDFKSLRDQGRTLGDPVHEREWAIGISVYDDFHHACRMARRLRFRQGTYIARIVVPDAMNIEIRQTFRDRRHFTIYALPEIVLALVEGLAVTIPDTLRSEP